MNKEVRWEDLQVGDFIKKYNDQGRGQKILAKCGEVIILSYCESTTDHWENVCQNISKNEFLKEINHKWCLGKTNNTKPRIIKGDNEITNMKITNLVKKILDKDTRTLVKAGFINGDLALTDEGVSELLGILFLEKKEELLKVANEKIDEDNK